MEFNVSIDPKQVLAVENAMQHIAHRKTFHTDHILGMLKAGRETGNSLNILMNDGHFYEGAVVRLISEKHNRLVLQINGSFMLDHLDLDLVEAVEED